MTTRTFVARRDEIIRVAASMFAERGYHATGISDLASAVGLGRGALYRYIDSKENLLYDICMRQIAILNPYAEGVLARQMSAQETLVELGAGVLTNVSDNQAEWVTFFREWTPSMSP